MGKDQIAERPYYAYPYYGYGYGYGPNYGYSSYPAYYGYYALRLLLAELTDGKFDPVWPFSRRRT